MGQSVSAEPPRTKWIYLHRDKHEFRLIMDEKLKTVSIIEWNGALGSPEAVETVLGTTTLEKFAHVASADPAFHESMVQAHVESFLEDAQVSAGVFLKQ